MKRRVLLALASGAVAPWPARAQTRSAPAVLRVGTANIQPRSAPQWVAFLDRMAALGYIEGRNLTYDHVQIPNEQAWEGGYRGVVARKPDLVVAAGPEPSLRSVLAVSGKLPVVMIAVDFDPVARGYIKSLARPSGNVTGVHSQITELAGKHLQLMKDAFPDFNSATVLVDPPSAGYWAALQAPALRLGVRLVEVELREVPYDYEKAIATVAPQDRRFLFAMASPFYYLDRVRLAELSLRNGIVSVMQARAAVAAGCLLSYGPDLDAMFALAADYVDRIAKGANPIDLPVQQPTRFDLVLNLGTAKALGLTIPPSILARADEVIE